MATTNFTMASNILGSSELHLFYVTILATRSSRGLLDFLENLFTPDSEYFFFKRQ